MQIIFIPFSDICSSSLPPILFIVFKLIENGAPIKLTRDSKFDTTELSKGEFIVTEGKMMVRTDWEKNGLLYEFHSINNPDGIEPLA